MKGRNALQQPEPSSSEKIRSGVAEPSRIFAACRSGFLPTDRSPPRTALVPVDHIIRIQRRNALSNRNKTQGYEKAHHGISDAMAFKAPAGFDRYLRAIDQLPKL